MTKFKSICSLVLVGLLTFGMVGCVDQLTDKLGEPLLKANDVVVKALQAIDEVQALVAGSEIANKVDEYLLSLESALEGVKTTLNNVALLIGVDLPEVSDEVGTSGSILDKLNGAVDELERANSGV